MAPGELHHVVRRGFPGFVPSGLEPLVLEDGHLEGDGPLRYGIHLHNVCAAVSFNFADGDHRAIPDATVKLLKAEVKMSRTEVYRAIGAVGKSAHGSQHTIILLAKLGRGGVQISRVALRKQQPLDPQPIHAPDQHLHALFGSVARNRAEVTVNVPDPEVLGSLLDFRDGKPGLGKCQCAACAKGFEDCSAIKQCGSRSLVGFAQQRLQRIQITLGRGYDGGIILAGKGDTLVVGHARDLILDSI
jgi:hypothetical protein